MIIDLDDTDLAALRDLVESRLVNLSSEIRHTDSPQVRQALRELREALRRVRERLDPLAA